MKLFMLPGLIKEPVPGKLEEIYTMYQNNLTAFPMYEPFKSKLDGIVTNETTYVA